MHNNNTPSGDLPRPSNELQAHSNALQGIIKQAIATTGTLSFADFMRMALYEPQYGYYSAGLQKFGAQGDFVTAPEISPLYSYALANQCIEVFERIGHRAILEFGAGSGRMAADILHWLQQQEQTPEHYYILEVSAELKQRQYETIKQHNPELLTRIQWLSSLDNFHFNGVVLANEVLDAMPVHRFQIQSDGIYELCVVINNNGFTWSSEKAGKGLTEAVHKVQNDLIEPIAEIYISEINLNVQPWFAALADCIQSGALFLIDYGYPRKEFYLPERSAGTLMCHYQHRAHADPLILCGLQDITAYVDFTAVIEAADAVGFELEGFTTQADFLIGCGIERIFNQTTQFANEISQLQAAQELKTLTLPSEMGERFKVIGLSKGMHNSKKSLAGFSIVDYSNRL